jgi:hypothetical protein
MNPPLPELKARLLLDTLESAERNILLGERYRNAPGFDGMLELLMAASLGNLEPAGLFELSDDFPAVHRRLPFLKENTHFVYTNQGSEILQKGI